MKIRTLDIDELNDRLAELETLRDAVQTAEDDLKDAEDEDREAAEDALETAEEEFGAPEKDELAKLEALRDEIGESRGKISEEGGPFVDESDFEDYARELAEDLGSIPRDVSWPCTCIDWERAADELKTDYSSVEWDGTTYLYRAS